jgi:hypothetical protein
MAGSLYRVPSAVQATKVWGWEDWILTTDTDNLYMGDGVTVGGLQVGGIVPGSSGSFLGLSDTPGSYSGHDGKFLAVSGSSITFVESPSGSGGASYFVDLLDTPGSLGSNGQVLIMAGGVLTFATMALSSLSNVSATAPTTGQSLVWNGSQWAPSTISGGGGGVSTFTALSDVPDVYTPLGWVRINAAGTALEFIGGNLNDLNNVNETGKSPGYALTWNGSAWTPAPIPAGTFTGLTDTPGSLGANGTVLGVSGAALSFLSLSLSSLSNVSGTAPTTGQALVWSGSNWAPATISAGGSTTLLGLTDVPDVLGTNGSFLGVQSSAIAFITPAMASLSDVSIVGRATGSLGYFNGTAFVFTPAPANNQGVKYNSTLGQWVFEDVLIVDLNLSPTQTTVLDGYARGTMLMADDEEDSYNSLPPGTNGQILKVISGLPTWVTDAANGGIYQYASRAAAVADTGAWASASFPCLLLLEGEIQGGAALDITGSTYAGPTTGTSVQKPSTSGIQAYMLMAAPSATRNPSVEYDVSGRIFDDNGEWATDTHPFPKATHSWSNFLSRSAPKVLTVLPGDGTNAKEVWLPFFGVVGRFTIPVAQIAAGIAATKFMVGVSAQITKWRMEFVGGVAAANTEAALYITNRTADFSTHATVTNGTTNTVSSGLSSFVSGALPTGTGVGGDPGLVREGSILQLQFFGSPSNAFDIQVTLYGYFLDSAYPLV